MNCECEKLKNDIKAYQAHIENKFSAEIWFNPSFNKFIHAMKDRVVLKMREEIELVGGKDSEKTLEELRNKIVIMEQWNCELEVDLQMVRNKQRACNQETSLFAK